MPFVSYALISKTVAPSDLRQLARYQITPLLTGIPGVQAGGGSRRQDAGGAGLCRARRSCSDIGLTIDDIAKAVSDANTLSAVGRLEDNRLLYLTSQQQFLRSGR